MHDGFIQVVGDELTDLGYPDLATRVREALTFVATTRPEPFAVALERAASESCETRIVKIVRSWMATVTGLQEAYERAMEAEGVPPYQREHIHAMVQQARRP